MVVSAGIEEVAEPASSGNDCRSTVHRFGCRLLNFTSARFISITARCMCAAVISVGRIWMRSNAVRMISPPDGLKLYEPDSCTLGENMASVPRDQPERAGGGGGLARRVDRPVDGTDGRDRGRPGRREGGAGERHSERRARGRAGGGRVGDGQRRRRRRGRRPGRVEELGDELGRIAGRDVDWHGPVAPTDECWLSFTTAWRAGLSAGYGLDDRHGG